MNVRAFSIAALAASLLAAPAAFAANSPAPAGAAAPAPAASAQVPGQVPATASESGKGNDTVSKETPAAATQAPATIHKQAGAKTPAEATHKARHTVQKSATQKHAAHEHADAVKAGAAPTTVAQ